MFNNECILIKDIKPGLKNINVIFIVLDIGSATVTKENREVRNFKVGDHTAVINVSIWDEPGKVIAPGDIIKLTKGYASIWRHCLTLYSGKNGEVFKIGEFCMTFNEQLNMSDPKRQEQQQQSITIGISQGNGAPLNISPSVVQNQIQPQNQQLPIATVGNSNNVPVIIHRTTTQVTSNATSNVPNSQQPQHIAKVNRVSRTNTSRTSNSKSDRR